MNIIMFSMKKLQEANQLKNLHKAINIADMSGQDLLELAPRYHKQCHSRYTIMYRQERESSNSAMEVMDSLVDDEKSYEAVMPGSSEHYEPVTSSPKDKTMKIEVSEYSYENLSPVASTSNATLISEEKSGGARRKRLFESPTRSICAVQKSPEVICPRKSSRIVFKKPDHDNPYAIPRTVPSVPSTTAKTFVLGDCVLCSTSSESENVVRGTCDNVNEMLMHQNTLDKRKVSL